MPLEGLIDKEEELQRLEKEKQKILISIERTEKMLSNPGFLNKAPEAKVNEERVNLDKYKEMLEKVEANILKMK